MVGFDAPDFDGDNACEVQGHNMREVEGENGWGSTEDAWDNGWGAQCAGDAI